MLSQSTEDSEPIYDQPHRPLLSDSEHERPSSTSPPPFSSGHHHHHHPPPSRGEHYNANDTRHSELLVKPSMIKKRQGTNAGKVLTVYFTHLSEVIIYLYIYII